MANLEVTPDQLNFEISHDGLVYNFTYHPDDIVCDNESRTILLPYTVEYETSYETTDFEIMVYFQNGEFTLEENVLPDELRSTFLQRIVGEFIEYEGLEVEDSEDPLAQLFTEGCYLIKSEIVRDFADNEFPEQKRKRVLSIMIANLNKWQNGIPPRKVQGMNGAYHMIIESSAVFFVIIPNSLEGLSELRPVMITNSQFNGDAVIRELQRYLKEETDKAEA